MKTWVLIAASSTAMIYLYESVSKKLSFTQEIKNRPHHSPNRFAKYLNEEMEIACGAGTNAHLVIWGEPIMIKYLSRKMSMQLRSAIIDHFSVGNLLPKMKALQVQSNLVLLENVTAVLQRL